MIDAALLVDVGDLQVEPTFACPDLPDALEQLVEVVLAESLVELQALVVEHEALGHELPECLRGPDPEARGLAAVDAVADRNDRVEIVEHDLARNLATSLASNSPNSLDSCCFAQLPGGEDLLEVIADRANVDAEELGELLLVQPEGLGLVDDLDARRPLGRPIQDDVALEEPGRFIHDQAPRKRGQLSAGDPVHRGGAEALTTLCFSLPAGTKREREARPEPERCPAWTPPFALCRERRRWPVPPRASQTSGNRATNDEGPAGCSARPCSTFAQPKFADRRTWLQLQDSNLRPGG